jgi:MFS superfamily sulfate permease-like transporter
MRPDEPATNANQELFATGLSNAGGALLGAMPAGGGTTQTAVNRQAGARTQLSELVTAGGALVTMLLLSGVIALMPEATLAAVVIVYSISLIKPKEFRAILEVRRTEFIWAIAAMAGVVLLGTLKGILVAIVVSVIALAHQVADPPVFVLGRKPGTNFFRPLSKEHPEDETFPGLLLLRLEGRLFFLNAEHIGQKIRLLIAEKKPRVVAIHLRGVFDLEYTALNMLIEGEKKQRERGVLLWLVGINPQVLTTIQRSSLGKTLGPERMHFTLEVAVAKFLESRGHRMRHDTPVVHMCLSTAASASFGLLRLVCSRRQTGSLTDLRLNFRLPLKPPRTGSVGLSTQCIYFPESMRSVFRRGGSSAPTSTAGIIVRRNVR